MILRRNKTGLALGVTMAVFHILWSAVVVAGWGQQMMDMVFKFHYLSNPFRVVGFSLMNFVGLVILTFVSGYIVGWIFAWAWNMGEK